MKTINVFEAHIDDLELGAILILNDIIKRNTIDTINIYTMCAESIFQMDRFKKRFSNIEKLHGMNPGVKINQFILGVTFGEEEFGPLGLEDLYTYYSISDIESLRSLDVNFIRDVTGISKNYPMIKAGICQAISRLDLDNSILMFPERDLHDDHSLIHDCVQICTRRKITDKYIFAIKNSFQHLPESFSQWFLSSKNECEFINMCLFPQITQDIVLDRHKYLKSKEGVLQWGEIARVIFER